MIFQSLESLNELRKFIDAHSVVWHTRDVHFAFRNVVFLTGPVGAGKSFASDYISRKLHGFNKVEIVSLSKHATLNEGKVIVDCSALARDINSALADFGFICVVLEGTSDNLEEVLRMLDDVMYDSLQLVCVRPHARMFKWNNGLKAAIVSLTNDDVAADYRHYADMNEEKLESEIGLLTSNYLSILVRHAKALGASITTVKNNRIRSMHSGLGWHRILVEARYTNWSEVAKFLRLAFKFLSSFSTKFRS